ncbi:N-formylglutamate deformylase [Haliangium ochraceum]|uniref:N-formylglutamate amidohydrolase n=1 Tax=Haliangium ochraceum (strain DSM 14365 / JCM 11303 / SMP-2) TaxID=502025 RepID=D0LYT2_HALO1|nr:N-formylglutamate deformylase [Haliangium ochraceum]ACY14402.1 N-formylglutamate amidohydrolase [Haliangium ochraceum DSM 14365]
MDIFELHRGRAPLLISVPHAGTHLPEAIAARMNEGARALPDTDWHVHRLYAFARDLGASMLVATHSRYVVDLNRDPAGTALYAGQDETGLMPTSTFERAPIYLPGREPATDATRVDTDAARVDSYWRPYHDALAGELERLRQRHGRVVLFDAHSIRSQVPRFFAGTLPHLNLGTRAGSSADPGLIAAAEAVLGRVEDLSWVRDGRFRGGYITRHYGRPEHGVHALQLEMAQRAYMDEAPPYGYREDLAARLQPHLRALLSACLAWAESAPANPG